MKVVRCKCGAGCDDYDYNAADPSGGCEGQVMVHDPDDLCPRHECEAHARPPKCERISREAHK